MDALAISQMIFYIVFSLVVLVIGVLLFLILFKLLRTIKDVEALYQKIRGFVSRFIKPKK